MVKVGFIVEGDSEKIIIESESFLKFLQDSGFELVMPVINAKGGGNLLPDNIEPFIKRLESLEAERLYILTDSENDNIEDVKTRIQHAKITSYFIAVKALEAWFLADTEAMGKFLEKSDFSGEEYPEKTENMPWDRIKEIANEVGAPRGPGSNKVAFAKKMIKYWGFSIEKAAEHPNCLSAKQVIQHFKI